MKYLYKPGEDYSNHWVYDIETDGLAPTTIWCCVVANVGTGERYELVGIPSIRDWFRERVGTGTFIGHNSLYFDNPALRKLADVQIPDSRSIDTLVLSYLYSPHLDGGHSLASYGDRLGCPKVEHDEWGRYSDEMLQRCIRDVELTLRVWKKLSKRMQRYSNRSCRIEHEARVLINDQERNGFRFDRDRAAAFRDKLRWEQLGLTVQIYELFPPELKEVGHYKKARRKDGGYTKGFISHSAKYDRIEELDDGSYRAFAWASFDLASPQQRVARLLELGWEPIAKTKAGNPKVDEDSLRAYTAVLRDRGEAFRADRVEAIAEWLILQGRSSMIETWLKFARKHADGGWYLHGKVFTCGAQSRRMAHVEPNTANIPSESNKAKYGREIRECWIARPGRKMVGVDAKGLQGRLFVHYVKDFGDFPPELEDIYINGDPHGYNAGKLTEGLGFEVIRGGGGAKTIYYALIFGGQDPKLGSILKRDRRTGGDVRRIMQAIVPGLGELTAHCAREWKATGGRLLCIDGGWVVCDAPHAAINYKIQSAEAIVMKRAFTQLRYECIKLGWWGQEVLNVGNIHDEGQFDCDPRIVEPFRALACQSIVLAGQYYRLNVPMAGDSKVGDNWHETH